MFFLEAEINKPSLVTYIKYNLISSNALAFINYPNFGKIHDNSLCSGCTMLHKPINNGRGYAAVNENNTFNRVCNCMNVGYM